MTKLEKHSSPAVKGSDLLHSPLGMGGATAVTLGIVDVAAHLGPTGLLISGLAGIAAYSYGGEIMTWMKEKSGFIDSRSSERADHTPKDTHESSLLEEFDEIWDEMHPFAREDEDDEQGDDELRAPVETTGLFAFSRVLRSFTPSRQLIYLGRLMDGTPIYCTLKELCHVALAGSTGGGKTSLIRLIMSQICYVGANVLLLNPHYTRYDVDADEDWTPFEPYLVYDPMECRKYEVIEHYLKQVAKEIMPRRLEKYAHSQPVGKPYFLVLDELPSIVRNVPDAPGYLEAILQEGRKVGIYLVTAAQDFLVKTIAPQGGGAMRECYRTALYVGGDPTTAKTLLDIPAKDVPENDLGKGTIMIRNITIKKAQMAQVPYVDNQALYRLLGPSTFNTSEEVNTEDLELQSPVKPTSALISSLYQRNTDEDFDHSEMAVNALVDTVPAINTQVPETPFPGTVWGPDDRQFTPEQSAEFLRLYRKKTQPVKDILRMMDGGKGVSNRYSKYAFWLLKTTGEVK